MRAIVRDGYGGPDVLRLEDVAAPTVTPGRVLVRQRAASLNAVDWHELRGKPYLVRGSAGLLRPRVSGLGRDLAGVVEAVGDGVTRFAVGDEVFGMSIRSLADFVLVAEEGLVPKPASVTFEQAAAVPVAAITALQALRDVGGLRAAERTRVLVHGAGGGVGTFAVQVARILGAEVVASTRPGSIELVRSLGAERVVHHTEHDLAELGGRFDLVLALGGRRTMREWSSLLAPEGVLVSIGAPHGNWLAPVIGMIAPAIRSRFGTQRFASFLSERKLDDLETLAGWLGSGELRPVIDSTVPLGAVPDALARLERESVVGKVVVAIPG